MDQRCCLLFVLCRHSFSSLADVTVCTVGARIPQIGKCRKLPSPCQWKADQRVVKNFETRCEGLSPALFCFSIGGNVTYTLRRVSLEHELVDASDAAPSSASLSSRWTTITLSGIVFYASSQLALLLTVLKERRMACR